MPLPKGNPIIAEYYSRNNGTSPNPDSYPSVSPGYKLPNSQPQQQPQQVWNYKTSPTSPGGESLPNGAKGWRPDGSPDFGAGLQGWWQKAYYNVSTAWDKGWNTGENLVKSNHYQTDIVPRFTSSLEATKAIGGEMLWGGLNLLGQGAKLTEQVAGTIGLAARDISQGKQVGGGDYWKNNWEASQLAYNIAIDGFRGKGEDIRNEFIARMQAGERPELIAEDMSINGKANPWIEMAGQMIFDPLMADLYVNWFGKSRKALSIANEVKKAFATFENPAIEEKIAEAVKGGDQLKASETFQEALKLHKKTAGGVQEMVTALQKPGFVSPKGLPERVKQFGMLVPDSRRLALSNRMGAVVENIVKSAGGDPAEVLDIVDAMAKSISKNPADAAEGFRHMTEFKNPAILMSQAGNELTAVVGNIIEKHGAGLLDELSKAKNTSEMAQTMGKILNGTLDELFPSATDMLKAMETVKNVGKTGEAITPEIQRLADLGGRMSPVERTIGKMHMDAQKGIVGKFNKAFSNLYMNWNPGYAFRNGLQNNLQIFLDHGPSAFLKSSDAWFADAEKLHGSAISAHGMGPTNIVEGTKSALKTPVQGTGLVDALKAMFKNGFSVRATNEVIETNGARKVIGYTYQKTFKDALKPLVDSLAKDEQFKGLPPDVWNHIQSELFNNFGDTKAALNAVRESVQSGTINLFQDANRIPKGLKDFLFRTGQNGEVSRVLQAATKEEALAANAKMFDNLDTASKAAYLDGIPHTPGDPLSDALKLAQQDGYVSESRGLLIEAQRQVTNESLAHAKELVYKVQADLAQQGIAIPPEMMKSLDNLMGYSAKTSDEVAAVRQATVGTIKTLTDGNINQKWLAVKKVLPGLGEVPITKDEAIKKLWDVLLTKYEPEAWAKAREVSLGEVPVWMDRVEQELGAVIDPNYRTAMDEVLQYADQWKNVSVGEMGLITRETGVSLEGTKATQIAQLAEKYGISSATYAGVPKDQYLLNVINKYAGVEFKSLDDPISMAMVNKAFAKKTGQAEQVLEVANKVQLDAKYAELNTRLLDKATPPQELDAIRKEMANIDNQLRPTGAEYLYPPYKDGTMPTYARMLQENDLAGARTAMETYISENFNKLKTFAVDPTIEGQLRKLEPLINDRMQVVRTVSQQVAEESRNFTLLNYGQRTYFDVASAYLMPYGFWYKGTYNNWLQRIVYNPAVLAGYGKYKEAMNLTHAGLPDWWKQNLQVDNILGIPLEHPLFFNLENTLNPLNGITGVDFTDQSKVTNWWTYTLQNINQMGPNTWTPISIATGLALRAQGQTDAGNAWIGRVIPQTAAVKVWTGKELDPAVGWLMGGYDKYERRRIGRALSEMVQQGTISPEAAIEADRTQQGQIWEQAAHIANGYRQMGQTFSTLFGSGFKARSPEDMKIDQFDAEYQKLMTMRPNLSADDFKNQLAVLGQKYPFMDTVLISRRTGADRDLAYAYNVLGRLQPGDASNLLKIVGVQPELVNRFYNAKGDMSSWTEGDRMRFMGAMVDLGAITKIPDGTTKQEWNATRSQYTAMQEAVKQSFGSDIYGKIDDFYAVNAKSSTDGQTFLQQNPEVDQAMAAQRAYIVNNQLLNTYYGGIDTIQQYYTTQERAVLEKKYGKNIYAQYYAYLDEVNPKVKRQLHTPELKAFIKERSKMQDMVNQKVSALASKLPDAPQTPLNKAQSPTQTNLGNQINAPTTVSSAELASQMSPYLQQLVSDYLNGEPLPYAAKQQLDFMGQKYNLNANDILQIIGSGR